MLRLIIHVEGETEETFVNELLTAHLHTFGYEKVSARLLGNSRQRSRRGGIKGWNTVRGDILAHLKEDRGCVATTMVDYYGLPQQGQSAWPGRFAAATAPFLKKSLLVEEALLADVAGVLGPNFDMSRFLPFVMMHEFEGLLFSDCRRFGESIGAAKLGASFQRIRDQFNTPEEINDSPLTAPSKRIKELVPNYEKPLLGALAAIEIGLDTIRAQCPHFSRWLDRLERWPGPPSVGT